MTCRRVPVVIKDPMHVVGQEPRTHVYTAIVCDRGARRRATTCQEPHCTRPHTKLCDYPVTRKGKPGTCDRRICDGHATPVGPDRDYCTAHARAKPPEPAPEPEKRSDQLSFFGNDTKE